MLVNLTPEQRRNYIATARRMQPLDELLRKAKKANRRGFKRVFAGVEGSDYVFAKDYRVRDLASFRKTFRITYCGLCGTFAKPGFPRSTLAATLTSSRSGSMTATWPGTRWIGLIVS
jgi:hypothetical protein